MFLIKFSCAIILSLNIWQDVTARKIQKKLSRQKRYVAFPEGAAFSAVYCVTSQMGITDGAAIFTEGINWGFVYDLPNNTVPLFLADRVTQKRRNRRELYSKIEDILTSMGYNGKSCILRSLCEAQRIFKTREDNLIFQILNIIFNFAHDMPVLANEPDDHRLYHWASKIGSGIKTKARNFYGLEKDEKTNIEQCSDIFQCPFSLIDMALGHYS